MYCSSCAKEVVTGLIYCNHCGHRLSAAKVDDDTPSEIKSALLVLAMIGLFIFGLLAIAILIRVLKEVAGFDLTFLTVITVFSFGLMLAIEGVLISMLFRRKKAEKEESSTNQLNERGVKQMYAAPTRELPESTFQPLSSVTEHTTRTLEQMPKRNQ